MRGYRQDDMSFARLNEIMTYSLEKPEDISDARWVGILNWYEARCKKEEDCLGKPWLVDKIIH